MPEKKSLAPDDGITLSEAVYLYFTPKCGTARPEYAWLRLSGEQLEVYRSARAAILLGNRTLRGGLYLQGCRNAVVNGAMMFASPDSPNAERDPYFVEVSAFLAWMEEKGYSTPEHLLSLYAAVKDETPLSDNCFEDKGQAFRIRFEGVDCVLPDRKGVKILHKLISKRDVEIPLQELDPPPVVEKPLEDRQVSDCKGKKRMATIHEADVVDGETIGDIRKQLEALKNELEDAKELGNRKEQEDIKEKMKPLLTYLGSVTNRAGKPRKRSHETKKQIKALQKNVNSVYKALREKNAPLEKHLRESIHIGERSYYKPHGGIDWQT